MQKPNSNSLYLRLAWPVYRIMEGQVNYLWRMSVLSSAVEFSDAAWPCQSEKLTRLSTGVTFIYVHINAVMRVTL